MYVSSVSIKNFRNFTDPPFSMNLQPFTLIMGENNIGKTNLLAALSLIFNQEISVTQQRSLIIDDINYSTVNAFKKQVADQTIKVDAIAFPEVEIHVTLSDIQDDQHPVVGDWYSKTDLSEASLTYRFALRGNFKREKWIEDQRKAINQRIQQDVETKPKDDTVSQEEDYSQYVDFPIGEYRHTIYGGGRPANECESWLLQMLCVEILDALRDAERELVGGGEQRLLFRVLRQKGDSQYTSIKQRINDLKEAIDSDPSLGAVKSEVQKLLRLVSLDTPGEDHSVGLHFASPESDEILKKIGMVYGTDPITVARNGLGRNNLLYVALVLSQLAKPPALSASDDVSVCFRLIGIEEPEAHLHPHLQDHLADNIESIRNEHSASLQLILTSHSTHVATKLSLENTVVLFRRESDGALASHYILDGINPIKDKDAVRFLSLYLDATKSRMFFARKLILVEGIAEQVIMPLLFKQHTGKSLESVGCTVVNVNGVAFRHFLTIVKNGFFTKCVALTDSDSGTKTENRAENLRADFESISHIKIQVTTESTFEKELISANKSGDGKQLLLEALCMTKPNNGPKFKTKTGDDDINAETFFAEIEKYKAEFAFSLVTAVQSEPQIIGKEVKPIRNLVIPEYISDAFNFIAD